MSVVEVLPEGAEATRDDALVIEWSKISGRETAHAVIDADPCQHRSKTDPLPSVEN